MINEMDLYLKFNIFIKWNISSNFFKNYKYFVARQIYSSPNNLVTHT